MGRSLLPKLKLQLLPSVFVSTESLIHRLCDPSSVLLKLCQAWDAPAAPAVPESDVVIGEGGELSGAPDSLMGEGQGLTMEWVGKPSPDNPLFQERSPSELAEQSAALDKLAKVTREKKMMMWMMMPFGVGVVC